MREERATNIQFSGHYTKIQDHRIPVIDLSESSTPDMQSPLR